LNKQQEARGRADRGGEQDEQSEQEASYERLPPIFIVGKVLKARFQGFRVSRFNGKPRGQVSRFRVSTESVDGPLRMPGKFAAVRVKREPCGTGKQQVLRFAQDDNLI